MGHLLLASSIHVGGFKFTGSFTTLDLIAAATNSLNGALLARRPDHYKQFTAVGIILMALLGGLGGGITRDILVGQIPSALTNPAYITLSLLFGFIGYHLAYGKGQLFREGIFQFVTSFSLVMYAIVGVQKGVGVGLPILACLLLGIVGPTAGRYYIDITCRVSAKQFIQGEWFVGAALLTAAAWIVVDWITDNTWWAFGIAFPIGFTFRVLALYRGWEEPLATEPRGVIVHGEGRPLLGRKLHNKSQRELKDLGLTVEADTPAEPQPQGG